MDEQDSVNDEQVADVQTETEEIQESTEVDIDSQEEISGKEPEVTEPEKTPEKIGQSKDDNTRFAAARREAEQQAKILKDRQDNFAKGYGYQNFEELEQAQAKQKYVDQGYDENMAQKFIQLDSVMQEMQVQKNKARISEEKSKLQNQRFFKELEPEIDQMIENNPTLSAEVAFKYIRGERFDDLISKESKAAAQRQLNNINGKSHMKPDGKGVDINSVQIDEEEWNNYRKIEPKATRDDYAKWYAKYGFK